MKVLRARISKIERRYTVYYNLSIQDIHENIAIITLTSHSSIPSPRQPSSSLQFPSPPHHPTHPSALSLPSIPIIVIHTKHRSTRMFPKPRNHMKMRMWNNLPSTHPFPSTHTYHGRYHY